jgi:hypothetical protein
MEETVTSFRARGVAVVIALGVIAMSACSSSAKPSAGATGNTAATGNKAKFCQDNATVAKAVTANGGGLDAKTLLSVFRSNSALVADFRANAPGEVVGDAQTLVDAADLAISANDASGLLDSHFFAHASIRIDAYCGQNGNGTPATSTKGELCEDYSLIFYAAALINGGNPTPANTLAVLKAKQTLIDDAGRVAPAEIQQPVQVIVSAAHAALAASDGTPALTTAVASALKAVQAYCGQDSDGVQTGNGPL